ncbi:hypothetical protein PQQ51_02120 [Paraburkholderia xenovorans]|uniref:hypothetical protein n=1 Tax=Paraburkholderia xenovorans TaxID=36873 RepID=UPI0038BDF1E0
MPTPAFRFFALVGMLAAAALLTACGDNAVAPAAATAKSACGNTTVANATKSCPPGFVPPAS